MINRLITCIDVIFNEPPTAVHVIHVSCLNYANAWNRKQELFNMRV